MANPVPGLVLVAGGKLTTYRVMARDAVDHAIRDFADGARRASPSGCRCSGRWGYEARTNQRVALVALRRASRSAWSTTCSAATAG